MMVKFTLTCFALISTITVIYLSLYSDGGIIQDVKSVMNALCGDAHKPWKCVWKKMFKNANTDGSLNPDNAIDFEVLKENRRNQHHKYHAQSKVNKVIGQFQVRRKHETKGTWRHPSAVTTPRNGK